MRDAPLSADELEREARAACGVSDLMLNVYGRIGLSENGGIPGLIQSGRDLLRAAEVTSAVRELTLPQQNEWQAHLEAHQLALHLYEAFRRDSTTLSGLRPGAIQAFRGWSSTAASGPGEQAWRAFMPVPLPKGKWKALLPGIVWRVLQQVAEPGLVLCQYLTEILPVRVAGSQSPSNISVAARFLVSVENAATDTLNLTIENRKVRLHGAIVPDDMHPFAHMGRPAPSPELHGKVALVHTLLVRASQLDRVPDPDYRPRIELFGPCPAADAVLDRRPPPILQAPVEGPNVKRPAAAPRVLPAPDLTPLRTDPGVEPSGDEPREVVSPDIFEHLRTIRSLPLLMETLRGLRDPTPLERLADRIRALKGELQGLEDAGAPKAYIADLDDHRVQLEQWIPALHALCRTVPAILKRDRPKWFHEHTTAALLHWLPRWPAPPTDGGAAAVRDLRRLVLTDVAVPAVCLAQGLHEAAPRELQWAPRSDIAGFIEIIEAFAGMVGHGYTHIPLYRSHSDDYTYDDDVGSFGVPPRDVLHGLAVPSDYVPGTICRVPEPLFRAPAGALTYPARTLIFRES